MITRLSGVLDGFFLAKRGLGRVSIINLLLSSSFGINALFYAAWLGYVIGAWALLIQAAWSVSFLLLIPHSKKFRGINSLHDFLGQRYGNATRVVASICSLIGIVYLVGWEVGIGKSAIKSLAVMPNGLLHNNSGFLAEIVIAVIVAITLIYTIIGGLRSNVKVDTFLNLVKVVLVSGMVGLLIINLNHLGSEKLASALFPSFGIMQGKLGLWGLATNILFNLSWQFVDNSSWISIIAGTGTNEEGETHRNLLYSSVVIFATIGVLGTILGATVSILPNINPENILTQAVMTLPLSELFLSVGMVVLIAACIMSLVDGMLITCSLTLIADVLPSWQRVSRLSSGTSLMLAKAAMLIVAVLSVWGIGFVIKLSGTSLFDFVYIVVISQLALIGPVVGGMLTKSNSKHMWLAIFVGLAVGFGSTTYGVMTDRSFLIDGAGTFTILASLIAAGFIATSRFDR